MVAVSYLCTTIALSLLHRSANYFGLASHVSQIHLLSYLTQVLLLHLKEGYIELVPFVYLFIIALGVSKSLELSVIYQGYKSNIFISWGTLGICKADSVEC